ncbi:MAG: MIP/aquaporin family protein [Gemmatimonadales bacterium]
MRRYVTEFIGTALFVLTIGLVVISAHPLAPLAIGCALMVLVYMGWHVSGAHYNPAVSLAAMMRGALPRGDLLPYWGAQILGAVTGAVLARILTGETFSPSPGVGVSMFVAFLAEALYTFALALVVLNVAVSRKTAGNSYFGLAIGFTIVIAAFAAGGISGGAFNPAVGTGPIVVHALLGSGGFDSLLLYWVGPLAGGALAAVVFGYQERQPAVSDVPPIEGKPGAPPPIPR